MIVRQDRARRAIERWAANLKAEREELTRQTEANILAAVDLLGEAEEVGFDAEAVAALLGVAVETLTDWRESLAARGLSHG